MASDDHANVDQSVMLEGGLGADTNLSTFSETEGLAPKKQDEAVIPPKSKEEEPAAKKNSDKGDLYFKEVLGQEHQLKDEVLKESNYIGEQIIEFDEDIELIDVICVGEDKQVLIV